MVMEVHQCVAELVKENVESFKKKSFVSVKQARVESFQPAP